MKIAGRKNDGAWFRANQFISDLNPAQRAQLANIIQQNNLYVDAAYNDILSMANAAGITNAGLPQDSNAWVVALLTHGIPRQIWNGNLSFKHYQKQPDGKVVPLYSDNVRKFAAGDKTANPDGQKSPGLRAQVTRFIFTRRAVNDLMNVKQTGGASNAGQNPGGYPDVTPIDQEPAP